MAGARRPRPPRGGAPARFLTIDVGGSGLKAAVVDARGAMLTDRVRIRTPRDLTPARLVEALTGLVGQLAPWDVVAVGFPGVIQRGRVLTAPNLGTDAFAGFDLETAIAEALGAPTRVANDAEIQGMAAISGAGVELVITLGTGFGSALFLDGRSLGVFEMGHHPLRHDKTYEDLLGKAALEADGKKKWNKNLARAIEALHALLYYDRLYIGGGHAGKITGELPPNAEIIANELGVRGGPALWGHR
ncbi:MAG: ROK family protein [Vicinamibacterales bacterium]